LGGIIIVDFIDMDEDSQRETVLDELKKAIATDRASSFFFLGCGKNCDCY
jgi:Ribonuclease G/E